MPSSFYRVYIRFGKDDCVRFLAPGDGITTGDGLKIFEWLRDPDNIVRLRNGLQYVYETDREEIRYFLEFKLRGDRKFMEEQMNKYPDGSDMLVAFKQQWAQFNFLQTGADKLEAISNAKDIMVIPRAAPRKRSDQPGWLYLLDLERETLEVYEFMDYRPHKYTPFARLTIESLYQESPNKPRGYYIKLRISELQAMLRSEWITLHETHAKKLHKLWRRNAADLQTIPHADSIPFAVLYGSVFYGHDENWMNPRRSRRLTQVELAIVLAALNRRMPSNMPIFERNHIEPRAGVEDRLRRWQTRMFRLRGQTERHQRRSRK